MINPRTAPYSPSMFLAIKQQLANQMQINNADDVFNNSVEANSQMTPENLNPIINSSIPPIETAQYYATTNAYDPSSLEQADILKPHNVNFADKYLIYILSGAVIIIGALIFWQEQLKRKEIKKS